MKKIILIFILVLFTALSADAATYYIDFAAANDSANGTAKETPWKRCPGMTGFAGSYSHSAGDIFVFKGGTTWTGVFPWTISYSGSSGNVDTYTTDHTWYTTAWSRPVFDDEGNGTAGGMIQADTKSYFKLYDLELTNHDVCGATTGKAIQFADSQQFTIDNCKLHTYDWFSINLTYGATDTFSNINITNNDVSTTSAMVWIGSTSAASTVDTINITGNEIYDGTCGVSDDIHADGIVHIFGVPTFNAAQRFTNVIIAYNYVHGDWGRYDGSGAGWTAFAYNEGTTSAKIYNNIIAPDAEGVFMGEAFLMFTSVHDETVEIYNNTLVNTGLAGVVTVGLKGGAYSLGDASTATFKGNLVTGFTNAVYYYTDGTVTSDYNAYNGALYWGDSSQSVATWQAANRDVNGVLQTDPLLVNPLSDVSLQSGSPCIGAFPVAQAPTGDFTDDYAGTERGSVWDIGAYEYETAVPANAIQGVTIN